MTNLFTSQAWANRAPLRQPEIALTQTQIDAARPNPCLDKKVPAARMGVAREADGGALIRFVPIMVCHEETHVYWHWICESEAYVRAHMCPFCKSPVGDMPGLVPFHPAPASHLLTAHHVRSMILRTPAPVDVAPYSRALHDKFSRQRSANFLATLHRDGTEALARWLESVMQDADAPIVADHALDPASVSMFPSRL